MNFSCLKRRAFLWIFNLKNFRQIFTNILTKFAVRAILFEVKNRLVFMGDININRGGKT